MSWYHPPAAYTSQVESQDTYVAPGVALSVVGSGGGGGGGYPSDPNFSTINMPIDGDINFGVNKMTIYGNLDPNQNEQLNIDAPCINMTTANFNFISSVNVIRTSTINGNVANFSSISTLGGLTVYNGDIRVDSSSVPQYLRMGINPGNAAYSLPIVFNNFNQDNVDNGMLGIRKGAWPDTNQVSTVRGLSVYAVSTVYGSFQPMCSGGLYIKSDTYNGLGVGKLSYSDTTSTLKIEAVGGGVSVPNLFVSTINGVAPTPPLISAEGNINVSSINGIPWSQFAALLAV